MGGDRGTRQGGRGGIDDIHGRVVRRAIHHVACTPIQNTGAGHVRFLPRPDPDICYPPLKSNAHNYQTENNVFWKVVGRKTPPPPPPDFFSSKQTGTSLFSEVFCFFFFLGIFSWRVHAATELWLLNLSLLGPTKLVAKTSFSVFQICV